MERIRPIGTPLPRRACWGAALAVLMAPSLAHATLGHAYDSVVADRAHMAARMSSTRMSTHTVHALETPGGGMVREFAGADGQVFAVAWRGPGRPDLRQLLGERFDTLQADNARRPRLRRTPMTVSRDDFVVRTGGHPGAFWGVAYLPRQLPAGFSGQDFAGTP